MHLTFYFAIMMNRAVNQPTMLVTKVVILILLQLLKTRVAIATKRCCSIIVAVRSLA